MSITTHILTVTKRMRNGRPPVGTGSVVYNISGGASTGGGTGITSVSTDATLTGDGSSGSPLSVVADYLVTSVTSSSSITPTGNYRENILNITALGVNTTINAPSGTLANNNTLLIRLKDDTNARTIAWNSVFRQIVTLPLISIPGQTIYITAVYNSTTTEWDVVGSTVMASYEATQTHINNTDIHTPLATILALSLKL